VRRALGFAVLAGLLAATPAFAVDEFWLGASGGWIKPDGALANFGWDRRPLGSWGLEARADESGWGLGLRMLSGRTTQAVGAGGITAAAVRTTRWELVGRRQVARALGTEIALTGSAGRILLSYDPDRVTVDGGSGPIEVELAPVGTWALGGGVAVERTVSRRLVVGLAADGARYALDTAHRAGDTVVRERTAFTDWGARVTLAWRSAPN
jgi:hypothetical protein